MIVEEGDDQSGRSREDPACLLHREEPAPDRQRTELFPRHGEEGDRVSRAWLVHADTSTGKHWLLGIKHRKYEKIVLFHIYTPAFNSYGWRKKLAEFYIERMQSEVPIDYVLLDYRAAMEYDTVLSEIKASIGARLKAEFGSQD